MRVVWKDSSSCKEYKPTIYRKRVISWYESGRIRGWIIDIENDHNVYNSVISAMNAIDKVLGGMPRRTCVNRQAKGIIIVGRC